MELSRGAVAHRDTSRLLLTGPLAASSCDQPILQNSKHVLRGMMAAPEVVQPYTCLCRRIARELVERWSRPIFDQYREHDSEALKEQYNEELAKARQRRQLKEAKAAAALTAGKPCCSIPNCGFCCCPLQALAAYAKAVLLSSSLSRYHLVNMCIYALLPCMLSCVKFHA